MVLSYSEVAALLALTPAQLAQIPAEAPPPGVVPDFEHPATTVPLMLGLSYTVATVATVCLVLRIWTRTFLVKRWQWDDITISLGYVLAIIHLAFVTRGGLHGGYGKHTWEISVAKLINDASVQQVYVAIVLGTPALGIIKMSLLIQFYILFNMRRYIRISVWIAAVGLGLFYTAVSLVAFAFNTPWHGESLLESATTWRTLKFADFAIPIGTIGMATDWFLFFLPMPAVWGLHLSLSKKIGVTLVFATGLLGAIASIVTLYYRVQMQRSLTDYSWKTGHVMIWVQVEMFAGVTASSMPAVRQFIGRNELLKSWASSPKLSFLKKLTHSSSDPDKRPGHVATLRSYKSQTRGIQANTENAANVDRCAGHDLPGQSGSDPSLVKEKVSASSKSVSVASW